MRALDIKVLRDLRRLGTQSLSVALVVASGVAGVVTFHSAVSALQDARDRFYREARFADVFADLVRAPDSVAQRLRELPGVAQVQVTVERTVRIETGKPGEAALGRLIGWRGAEQQALNVVVLRAGRLPGNEPGTAFAQDGQIEALVSEGFAQAHQLKPGDSVGALIEGRQRRLRLTGIAVSPEYVFAGAGGAPDPTGFGIFWIAHDTLAAALDMRGAFNRVAVRLAPQARANAVVQALDQQLSPWGGRPPYLRADQVSHAMLQNEIREQRVLGTILPGIFAAVAAFLLNVVISRLVSTQREQIATLKALGYGSGPITVHYLKLVGVIAATGLAIGLVAGNDLGRRFTGLFAAFFHFPGFEHRLNGLTVMLATLATAATAFAGTLHAIRRSVAVPPAVAMQPLSPAGASRTGWRWLSRRLRSPTLAMIVRNMLRRPWRSMLTVLGMAAAMAIVILGNFVRDAIEAIERSAFELSLRGDVVISLLNADRDAIRHDIARLPGVLAVESTRDVAVRFRNGHLEERGRIQAGPPTPELRRVMDVDDRQARVPDTGLLVTDRLARKLDVQPGDRLQVQILEGRMPVRELIVCCTVRDMMGLNAYMTRRSLNALMSEGDISSQFIVLLERGSEPALLAATGALPRVATTFSKAALQRNMRAVSGRNVRISSAVMTAFAAVIAVGIVYNAVRIALAERSWELASLRVLGFTRAEVSGLLLGEMLIGVLLALPLGAVLGWGLVHAVAWLLASDQFLFPMVILPRTYLLGAACVSVAALGTAAAVRRRIDRLDLVAVLKTRE